MGYESELVPKFWVETYSDFFPELRESVFGIERLSKILRISLEKLCESNFNPIKT